MSPPNLPGRREPAKGVKVAIVIFLTLSALNLLRLAYTHDPRLNAPPALGYVLGVTLLLGAAAATVKMMGREPSVLLILPILLGMGAMCAWIALSSNASCTSTSTIPLPLPSCRVGFGIGAAVLLLMVVMLLRGWWRRERFAAERRPREPRW